MWKVLTLTEFDLFILGLKLFGSLLNVIPSNCKNLFIPTNKFCGEPAVASTDGEPSNTITRSAK